MHDGVFLASLLSIHSLQCCSCCLCGKSCKEATYKGQPGQWCEAVETELKVLGLHLGERWWQFKRSGGASWLNDLVAAGQFQSWPSTNFFSLSALWSWTVVLISPKRRQLSLLLLCFCNQAAVIQKRALNSSNSSVTQGFTADEIKSVRFLLPWVQLKARGYKKAWFLFFFPFVNKIRKYSDYRKLFWYFVMFLNRIIQIKLVNQIFYSLGA